MDTDSNNIITNLISENLLPIAHLVLGEEINTLESVSIERIGRSVGVGTVGIFRVNGCARTSDGEKNWSVVVKVIGDKIGINNALEVSPHREIAVYKSRVFAAQHSAVRSVKCYAVQEIEDYSLLWMEDLSDAPQPPWKSEHYLNTAYNLGQFNAHWPENDLPDWPWLNRGGLRIKYWNEQHREAFEKLNTLRNHPLVGRILSDDLLKRLTQLSEESDALWTKVEQTPMGICHLDCHPKNLFPMGHSESGTYTIAIDWASVGIECFGTDIGILLASPIKWLEITPDEASTLVELILDAYIEGLHESGWSGNENQVKLAILACLGAGEASRVTRIIVSVAENPKGRELLESLLLTPVDEIHGRWCEALEFYLGIKDKALELAKHL